MSVTAFQLGLQSDRICIVVGHGLIGSKIVHYLSWHSSAKLFFKIEDWDKPKPMLSAIVEMIEQFGAKRVELIWSAGKSSFSSCETDVAKELKVYSDVIIGLFSLKGIELCVTLLSSAGGIYERSNVVRDICNISPSRPYAFYKLAQEDFLRKNGINARIYRVSSVYGLSDSKSRQGLVNSLIQHALLRKNIVIYANQNTLRDYILNNDVANYVVHNILVNKELGTEIMASGRAVSITLLCNMVHQITGSPIRATYSLDTDNDEDIIFDRSVLNCGILKTSLEEGIRLLSRHKFFSTIDL